MKELIKFEYLDNKLGLITENSKLIFIKYVDDYVVSYDVSSKEKEIIKEVIYELLPSNNINNLGDINFFNKDFLHLYDYDKKFHIFCDKNYNINNNCILLNHIFNNQEEYVTLLKSNNYMKRSQSRYIKRKVKIKDKIISVVALSAFLLTLSIGAYKGIAWINYYKEKNRYTTGILENENRQITIQDIENVILENSKLTTEEKELFLENKSFIYDNLEYLDYYSVINNLNNLYVEYIKSPSEIEGMYGDLTKTGTYSGRIRIYNAKNFKQAPRYALTHEFLHAFTTNYNPYNYLYEGLHVIFNNEYFSNNENTIYDNGYYTIRNYIYILCELLDEEVLKKYHADDNIDYLVNELIKIIPDREKAIQLITNIDSICRLEIVGANSETIKKIHQDIKNLLKEYYYAKYQISIEDNNYILFLFNPQNAYTKIASELNLDLDTFLLADEYGKVKQYKRIFNKNGNDDLILSIPSSSRKVPRIYTLDELLSGKSYMVYKDKESIDLEMDKNGNYIGYVYEPVSYIDVPVKSYSLENQNIKR